MIDQSLVQGSADWLALRRTKVTASDVPVILGLSPWKKVKQLYTEKMGEEQSSPSPAMEYGTNLEPEAREMYRMLNNFALYPAVRVHPQHDWLMASIDGISENGGILVEIKCPYSRKIPDDLPDHYHAQIQYQLYCSGIKKGYCFYYVPDNAIEIMEYKTFEVDFDQAYIDATLPRARAFYEAMKKQNFEEYDKLDFVQLTGDWWEEMADQFRCAKADLAMAEERLERIKRNIVEECKGQPAKLYGLKIEQRKRAGAVDYKKIPELIGVDLDQYRKPDTEYWQISEE